MQCWDSNLQSLEHESPPVTTRTELPLYCMSCYLLLILILISFSFMFFALTEKLFQSPEIEPTEAPVISVL